MESILNTLITQLHPEDGGFSATLVRCLLSIFGTNATGSQSVVNKSFRLVTNQVQDERRLFLIVSQLIFNGNLINPISFDQYQ